MTAWRERLPRIGWDRAATVLALFVSLLAMIMAWSQARILRAQLEADVLPILQIQTRYLNDETSRSFTIIAKNAGVGPAFVDRADYILNGKPIDSLEPLATGRTKQSVWTAKLAGQILASGETLELYSAQWEPSADGAELEAQTTASKIWKSLKIPTRYCSVDDRCWTTDINNSERPEETRSYQAAS